MHKAILVTENNMMELQHRFKAVDDAREPIVPGYILVAPFDSQDDFYDLLTYAELTRLYTLTGKKLENGFFEVERINNDG